LGEGWTDGTDEFFWMIIWWEFFGVCLFGMVMFIPDWVWAAVFGGLACMFLPDGIRYYILWSKSKGTIERNFDLKGYGPNEAAALFEAIASQPWGLKLIRSWGEWRGVRIDRLYETADGSPVTITVIPVSPYLEVNFKLSSGAIGLREDVERFAAEKEYEP
jgi:hypothetical protein